LLKLVKITKKGILSKTIITVTCILAFIALFVSFVSNFKVNAYEETYEVADEISVNDLNGASGKIVLSKNQSFSFKQTAEHCSTIFSFIYKTNDPSTVDCQFHFSTTWLGSNKGGKIWFKSDHIYVSRDNTSENGRAMGDPITKAGSYQCELGKLYCLTGNNQGKYLIYVKIENALVVSEYVSDMPLLSGIFLTGSNGDALIDSSWTGSNYTYMANGEVFDSGSTINDYLTKPATDPTKDGYEFIGWYDEMGYEWDFDNDVVRDGIVLKAGFKSLASETNDEVYFDDDNFTPVLRFITSSDVHMGGTDSRRVSNLKNTLLVAYQYAANSKYNKVDAALYAGDIADDGSESNMKAFMTHVNSVIKDETTLIVSMGNHDVRAGDVADQVDLFTSNIGAINQHHVINGFHFISVSPDSANGVNFSDEKLQWLDEQLAIAALDTPDLPIFVIQHEHVEGTVYGSDGWGVPELQKVLCKYPQVVDFSGHSHYPISDPRSIWQGTFTALGTGTLNSYEMGIYGYRSGQTFPTNKLGGWNTNGSTASQCAEYLIVEVDATGAIRVICYDLVSNTELCRYYIRNAVDEIKTKYSHTERKEASSKPVFDSDTQMNLSTEQNTITIEFDQAVCNDTIDSYRIELYEGETLAKTAYALSDYFFVPTPTRLKVKVESLKSLTDYTIKIYAVTVWGKECDIPLTGAIKTAQAEKEVLVEPDRISVSDIQMAGNKGIIGNISSEDYQWKYNGKSETFSSVMSFYLMVGELTSSDELRINVGNSWVMHNAIWFQKNDFKKMYFNFDYSSTPSKSVNFQLKNNTTYKIEYGLIYAEKGEHKGQWYTYLKVDDVLKLDFYCDANEQPQKDYVVTMHLTQAFNIADINLDRNIEYYVDGAKVQTDFAINGTNIKEPVAPTKSGYFFVGWYDKETGGERVDFNEVLSSSEKTIKYYARLYPSNLRS